MKIFNSLFFAGLMFASSPLLVSTVTVAADNQAAAKNVVLITLDGLRWQEVFRGIDDELATNADYSGFSQSRLRSLQHESAQQRAQALMPFLHSTVFKQGSYVGNRDAASCARVSNDYYFSFPGYSEILTGVVNPTITSNNKIPNPEKTFMELLDGEPEFTGKMAAFASWDVFPSIFNSERNSIPVNAYHQAEHPLTETDRLLNILLQDIPSPWPSVRLDAFTHHYAKSAIEVEKPRIIFIGYGETDDFAHDGDYDQYINAAQRTDRFISEIWQQLQSMDAYRDKTALFITVDHGRGEAPVETWQHHSSRRAVRESPYLSRFEEGIVGSDSVWMAAMGAGVAADGLLATGADCLTSNRIAATLMQLLGVDYRRFNSAMGEPMTEFLQ